METTIFIILPSNVLNFPCHEEIIVPFPEKMFSLNQSHLLGMSELGVLKLFMSWRSWTVVQVEMSKLQVYLSPRNPVQYMLQSLEITFNGI